MSVEREPQVIFEHGAPEHYCMGCDHYHDPAEGCAVVDHLDRGFVIDTGRYWPAIPGENREEQNR